MSISVCSRSSARVTLGSYSMSACSWVRLTATFATPGSRLSAFSIVPVHNEQCNPPMRARIRRRPGSLDGSSLQKRGAVSTVATAFIISTSVAKVSLNSSRTLQGDLKVKWFLALPPPNLSRQSSRRLPAPGLFVAKQWNGDRGCDEDDGAEIPKCRPEPQSEHRTKYQTSHAKAG